MKTFAAIAFTPAVRALQHAHGHLQGMEAGAFLT